MDGPMRAGPGVVFLVGLTACVEAHPAWVGMGTETGSGSGSATGTSTTGSGPASGTTTDATVTDGSTGSGSTSGDVTAGSGSGSTGPPCEPAVEVCNDLDDDCDGLVDEVAEGLATCGDCALEQLADHAYWFCTGPLGWEDARTACLDRGADLVSVRDEAEALYLAGHLTGLGGTLAPAAWLGLNDIDMEDTFVWADGTDVTYVDWESSEPNDIMGLEDCVEIRENKGGQWNDAHCTDAPKAYICWAPHVE